MKLTPRAKAVVGRSAQTTGGRYRPPLRPVDHSSTIEQPGHSLEQRIRNLLVDLWRECGVDAGESQLFRDAAREDGRSLGLVRLERGLLALAKDCPEAGMLIAAELAQWTEDHIPRPMGVAHYRRAG